MLKKKVQTLLQFTNIMNIKTKETIKISLSHLASVAGITRECLICKLLGFKKEGIIANEGRNNRIGELKAL